MTIAFLTFSASTFAAGGVLITISGNSGQTNTQATEFRYSQSPRDLAGGSAGTLTTAASAASTRSAAGGRATTRRANDPVVIVKPMDETSSFFVKAATSGETFTSIRFEFKRNAGSGSEIYQTVTLTHATISSVREANGDGRPAQEISITFQKIEYSHKDGPAAAPASWN
ncbi:MAG TPA: type VI secretion system tube protein Hcp [Pyrinomonadaceae bacterium]